MSRFRTPPFMSRTRTVPFLGFFPVDNPFFWLFLFRCRQEVLAMVTTDACGNFCVYLPS
jgi:hypothetical protein